MLSPLHTSIRNISVRPYFKLSISVPPLSVRRCRWYVRILVQMISDGLPGHHSNKARQTMLCSTAFGTSHINKLQFNSSYASLSNLDRLLLNSSAFCALLGFAIRAPPTSGILAPAWLQSQVWIRTVLLHRSQP